MKPGFNSTIVAKHQKHHARSLKVTTPHGEFITPCFMPVGTRAAVNCMTTPMLEEAGSQIILGGNTYHMLVNPGMDIIHAARGMHPFMAWQAPMLTDSGGFQVFSLSKNAKICKIDEQGAHFKHPDTGKVIHMTPAVSIKTQKTIGADIIMAFDQCTPEDEDKRVAIKAMERTHRWLLESIEAHDKQTDSDYGNHQALFGIIQGGSYRDLREQSAEFILKQPLDGIAIGGEAIGFDMPKTAEIIDWLRPELPEDKVRYTMGVGLHPQDLLDVVKEGIDIFDCVAPTRNARHGALYSGSFVEEDDWLRFDSTFDRGRLQIKKASFAKDERPIMDDCDCQTCTKHTRAYMHFLFKSNSPLYHPLATTHNIRVMHIACEKMRDLMTKIND
ncbi:MAG: tRNA guanosine(34) transglycosylase Tgt [Gammaproteobacteria bacterium CG11_big_fil_rev_8_21_14_0_20_46_22]|nr:MAG: tRNA guanosine(34) transglycosylase Tgt [Gammaproteobacteria bacterium CG12_big_fil_rev_8_21_14_0_65_46_12]PIR11023.1 MAG: tRNA guanosine(34) transglycosylase Tgt [Gammaproteobacteria bacterium CG11_big_fil_rev_8_21_14_0_20_46_22]